MAITRLNSLAIPAGTVVSADLTYPLTTFSSTGIDDNATSTAVTINASENVGIGTASPASILEVEGADPIITLDDTSAGGYAQVQALNGSLILMADEGASVNNSIVRFDVDGTERVRIDSSGNVGIGTSSPGGIFHIKSDDNGVIFQSSSSSNSRAQIFFQNTGGTTTGKIAVDPDGGNANVMAFSTGTTERMRIDNSGNVGIGTTSPAYEVDIEGSTTQTLHIERTDVAGADVRLESYAEATGGLLGTYTNSPFLFYTNNAERMRITQGGNVGIGTTSPSSLLSLEASNAELSFTDTSRLSKIFTQNGGRDLQIQANQDLIINASGGSNVGIGTSSPLYELSQHVSDSGSNYHQFTNSTTGTTSSAGFLVGISGDEEATLWNYQNTVMRFAINSTERMRINTNGNLLVNTTTAMSGGGADGVNGFGVEGTAANTFMVVQNTTNANVYLAKTSGYTENTFMWFYVTGTAVGSIAKSGSGVAYNTTSDQRLKENIVDAPAGNIDAIRVRSFDWKDTGEHQTYGMVAQELVDVAPEAVTQGKTDDDMWQVDYSKLVPMMIKEIQDLKAEVAALKGA